MLQSMVVDDIVEYRPPDHQAAIAAYNLDKGDEPGYAVEKLRPQIVSPAKRKHGLHQILGGIIRCSSIVKCSSHPAFE